MYRQMTLRTEQENITYTIWQQFILNPSNYILKIQRSFLFCLSSSTYNLYIHVKLYYKNIFMNKISYIKAVRPNKVKAPLWKPDYIQTNNINVFNTILFLLLSFVVEVYTKQRKKENNSIAEVWDNLFKSIN